MNMENYLTVIFFTVDRRIPDIICDGVRIPISDSANGEFSGSYGIKKGHARAVFSLKEGNVTLNKDGKQIFNAKITGGFAIVENNEVRITVDSVEEQ